MNKEWNELIEKAKSNLNSRDVSSFVNSGNYSCAILTSKGNVYCGVNISSMLLKTTAEKSAITNMISNGENDITKIVVINELEELVSPIIEAILYIAELDLDLNNVLTLKKDKEIKLSELLPDWWGTIRIAR